MWNRYVGIGIFVVVGSVLFAAAVFLIGDQHKFFAKHVELYTEVKNLNGLSKGAKIRVGGFDAGEVTAIGVPESPSSGFRLTLQITDQVRGLVRTDSVATIASEGVVGDKIVLIGSGSSDASVAAPHATLLSKETSDIADLVQQSNAQDGDTSEKLKI
jgi:phospholipid/cholesterol/gamma-HCH transport system substrate-binding protein